MDFLYIKNLLELNEQLIKQAMELGKQEDIKNLLVHRSLLKDELISLLEQQAKKAA
jgi:hypothetical protein